MKVDKNLFLQFCKSVLSDTSGISERTHSLLLLILSENTGEEFKDLKSSIVESCGRFFAAGDLDPEHKDLYIHGSESIPVEDFEIKASNEIDELVPLFVNLDLSMTRVSTYYNYIKHSDDPNCGMGFLRTDPNKVMIVSKRKIKKDEALTVDKNSLPWLDLFSCVMSQPPEEADGELLTKPSDAE